MINVIIILFVVMLERVELKQCTRIQNSMEGQGAVQMWRQVGSVWFPRNNRPMVRVEGTVRGYRVTTRHRGLGGDNISLCRCRGTLSFMCSRLCGAHATFEEDRNTQNLISEYTVKQQLNIIL